MNYEALSFLGYGMYFISSIDVDSGKSNALLAALAMQVSSEPATICISIHKNNYTHELIKKSKKFNISVIDMNATLELMGPFGFQSGRDKDKLANATCQDFNGISTITEKCNAVIECELIGSTDIGNSTVFYGKVINMKTLSYEKPMTYDHYQAVIKGGVSPNSPAHKASYLLARNPR